MIMAALSALFGLFILAIIGGGLALVLVPQGKDRFLLAISMAPALGLLTVGLLAFPLIKYAGPVHLWAGYFTVVLSACSLFILFRHRKEMFIGRAIKKALPAIVAILICWLVLTLPMVRGGTPFSVFGNNPSDAFIYMTLAETFRTAEWKAIWAGADLNDKEGMSRLASQSPTALYSARALLKSIRLASVQSFAWFSELTNLPIHRAYYTYSIFSFLAAVPLILVLGQLMSLPAVLRYGVLAPVVIGFWPQMLIDFDCISQMQYISILLLFVIVLYIIGSQHSLQIRPVILGAICLAGSVIFYTEFLAFILTCLLLWLVMERFIGKRSIKLVSGEFVLMIVLALALLQITDQLGHYSQAFLNQMKMGGHKNLGDPALFRPYLNDNWAVAFWKNLAVVFWNLFGVIKKSALPDALIHALSDVCWSLYYFIDKSALPDALIPVLSNRAVAFWGLLDFIDKSAFLDALVLILSVFLFILLAWSIAAALRKGPAVVERVLLAFILGAFISFVFVTLKTREVYLMGKTLFFVLTPFAAILLMTASRAIRDACFLPGRRIISGIAAAMLLLWTGTQLADGFMRIGGVSQSVQYRLNDQRAIYNIGPIIAHLNADIPKRLHVDVPATTEWPFSLYCMFAFAEYRPFFRSGLVYDNIDNTVLHGLQSGQGPADYVVIRKGVPPNGLKEKVAGSAALELYK